MENARWFCADMNSDKNSMPRKNKILHSERAKDKAQYSPRLPAYPQMIYNIFIYST